MKNINFMAIGIGILIVLNLTSAGFLFFGRSNKPNFHARMAKHEKMNWRSGQHTKKGNGDFKMDKRDRGNRMQELNLSPDQKEKLQSLKKEYKEKNQAVRVKIQELRKKEMELAKADKLQPEQMNALAQEYGQYQKDLHLLHMSRFQLMSKLLTKEQLEKIGHIERKGHNG